MAPSVPLSAIEGAKRLAAWTAVDKHVLPHHKVIGIGSGSTVPYVVDRILSQGSSVNHDRVFLATGFQSQQLIVKAHLRLGDIEQYPVIDVTIDGADDVDPRLNCIKGGADYRKNSEVLGASYSPGVPIEVAPFAAPSLLRTLRTLPAPPLSAALRMGTGKAGPVVTDNGNFVVDAVFAPAQMREPVAVLHTLKLLTGVVEVGLFCGVAKAAYFGNQDGSVTVKLENGEVSEFAPTKQA